MSYFPHRNHIVYILKVPHLLPTDEIYIHFPYTHHIVCISKVPFLLPKCKVYIHSLHVRHIVTILKVPLLLPTCHHIVTSYICIRKSSCQWSHSTFLHIDYAFTSSVYILQSILWRSHSSFLHIHHTTCTSYSYFQQISLLHINHTVTSYKYIICAPWAGDRSNDVSWHCVASWKSAQRWFLPCVSASSSIYFCHVGMFAISYHRKKCLCTYKHMLYKITECDDDDKHHSDSCSVVQYIYIICIYIYFWFFFWRSDGWRDIKTTTSTNLTLVVLYKIYIYIFIYINLFFGNQMVCGSWRRRQARFLRPHPFYMGVHAGAAWPRLQSQRRVRAPLAGVYLHAYYMYLMSVNDAWVWPI